MPDVLWYILLFLVVVAATFTVRLLFNLIFPKRKETKRKLPTPKLTVCVQTVRTPDKTYTNVFKTCDMAVFSAWKQNYPQGTQIFSETHEVKFLNGFDNGWS